MVNTISENSEAGTLLFSEVYKIRMKIASKGKGKSAGARVIYFNIFAQKSDDDRIVLLLIYDKSECENVTDEQIREVLKAMRY